MTNSRTRQPFWPWLCSSQRRWETILSRWLSVSFLLWGRFSTSSKWGSGAGGFMTTRYTKSRAEVRFLGAKNWKMKIEKLSLGFEVIHRKIRFIEDYPKRMTFRWNARISSPNFFFGQVFLDGGVHQNTRNLWKVRQSARRTVLIGYSIAGN